MQDVRSCKTLLNCLGLRDHRSKFCGFLGAQQDLFDSLDIDGHGLLQLEEEPNFDGHSFMSEINH